MRFYVREQLGPKREITQQGFLLCRDVPIARTGDQIYGPGESPIEVGPDGRAVVRREASEVFRPETMDSFNGSTFVAWRYENDLSHPKDDEGEGVDVVPENWKQYAAGYVFNVRRGKGTQDDLLLADIMVTDKEAIRLIVEDGKDELSCGYDSDYVDEGEGHGRQINILGNHVALVEQGRCGWRCSVQDSVARIFGGSMKKSVKITGWGKFRDSLSKAFATKDEAELNKALDAAEGEGGDEGAGEGDQHIHIHNGPAPTMDDAMEARFAALETKHADLDKRVTDCEAALPKKTADAESEEEKQKAEDKKAADKKAADAAAAAEGKDDEKVEDELEEEAPEGAGAMARKATDSAFLEDSFQTTLSNAEIIAPGIAFPTFDGAAKPKATFDSITAFRRRALGICASTAEGAVVIEELRAGRVLTHDALKKMGAGEIRTLFVGAAAGMRARNSAKAGASRTADSISVASGPRTMADVNRINAEFWSKQ